METENNVLLETPEEPEEAFRQERGERLVRFLDKLGAQDYFDSLEHKQAFIDRLTFEDFTRLITHINGIARELSKSERKIYQPVNMAVADEGWASLVGNEPQDMPPVEEKPQLLEYAFNRAKELKDPREIGLVIATSLNAVHPFGDGNGRTSRLVYDLLNYNYTGSERDREFLLAALSNEGRFITPDANPQYLLGGAVIDLIRKEGFTKLGEADYYFLNRAKKRHFEPRTNLDEDTLEKLRFLIEKGSNDELAVFLAISRTLGKSDRIAEFTSQFIIEEENINRQPLDSEKIVSAVTKEDIDNFYAEYWQVKTDMVTNMIDLLVENQPLPDSPPLRGANAKEYMQYQIANDLHRNYHSWEDLAEVWPEYPEETI